MSTWSKIEFDLWEKNEVLKEFEKKIKIAAINLGNKIEAQQTGATSKKVEEINKEVDTAQKGIEKLVNTTKNLAEDQVDDISDEDHEVAKASLIEELKEMAFKAANEGDKKLAYKIERTIEEILYEG